jgi:hypothetical protein
MSSDHETEIRASVAAHQDLGPGYEDAVAEGLVERIGAEIDKRIDARLGYSERRGPGIAGTGTPGPAPWAGPTATPGPAAAHGPAAATGSAAPAESGEPGGSGGPGRSGDPGVSVTPAGYQAPAGYQVPPGYQGYQGYMGPMLPPGYQMGPPPARHGPIEQRNVATTLTALGSIALGVAGTAVVSRSSNSGAQAIMVLLIWVAIAVINVAYARRH